MKDLDQLLEALENYGSEKGTKAQLNACTKFMKAFWRELNTPAIEDFDMETQSELSEFIQNYGDNES